MFFFNNILYRLFPYKTLSFPSNCFLSSVLPMQYFRQTKVYAYTAVPTIFKLLAGRISTPIPYGRRRTVNIHPELNLYN